MFERIWNSKCVKVFRQIAEELRREWFSTDVAFEVGVKIILLSEQFFLIMCGF